jgi:two-component sensor histidine kinase
MESPDLFDRRFREVCHRTKNDLQKLSFLLRAQAQDTGYPECRQCISRVEGMARLHDLLDREESAGPCASAFLSSIVDAARQAFDGKTDIELLVDDDLALEPRQMANLGSILHEAIMNASKHAFADGSTGRVICPGPVSPVGDR